MADPRSTLPGLTPAYIELRYGDAVLVPTPLIAFQQTIDFDEAGNRQSITETRTLNGSILTSGLGYHEVARLQSELESAFSVDGNELTIRSTADNPCLAADTYIVSGIFPKVLSIDITEDIQVNRLDYSIVLENVGSGVAGNVEDFSNSWQFTENDSDCAIDITHSISAKGIDSSTSGSASNAFENARAYVSQFLGLQGAPSGFPIYAHPPSGSNVGFHEISTSRSETVNLADGTYAVTEDFKLVSGLQPYVEQRTGQVQIDEENVTTVTLQGTVQGLGRTNEADPEAAGRTSGGIGFIHALSGFNNAVRPNFHSDAIVVYDRFGGSGTLVVTPQSLSITQNQCAGTIAYNVTFTDDPAENLPSGIQESTCSVQVGHPVRETALQNTPFRSLGPIFQRICTTTQGTYQVQCNVTATNTGDRITDTNRAIEYAESEMTRLSPNPSDYSDIYISARSQTTDDNNRTVSASITWSFSQDLATIPGDTAPVGLTRVS